MKIITKIEFSGRKVGKPTNLILVQRSSMIFGPRQMETGELIIYTSADCPSNKLTKTSFLWMNSTGARFHHFGTSTF